MWSIPYARMVRKSTEGRNLFNVQEDYNNPKMFCYNPKDYLSFKTSYNPYNILKIVATDDIVTNVATTVATPLMMVLLPVNMLLLVVLIKKRENIERKREKATSLAKVVTPFYCSSRDTVDCAVAFHLIPVALDDFPSYIHLQL